MVRWAWGLLVATLLVSTVCLSGGVVGSDEPVAGTNEPYAGYAQDFESVTVDITVYENGSARWTFRFTEPLNESTRSDFEAFAEEFNTTEGELYRSFQQRGETLESEGQANTGREMNVTGYSKRAYVDDGGFSLGTRGIVEMSFLWAGMAVTDGDRIEMSDVFEDGFYLGPRFSMVVRPGSGLAFARALPEPDSMTDADSLRGSRSITWQGEREFNSGRPLVELAPPESIVTTTTIPTTTTPATTMSGGGSPPTTENPMPTTTATGEGSSPATAAAPGVETTDRTTAPAEGSNDGTMLVIGLIILLLGIGTVAVWRVTTTGDGPTQAAEADIPPPEEVGTVETESQPAGAEAEDADVAGEELLSDTDRVKQLLESNEGRMRQSEIVKETEWSKSKVSMLLSDMEDDNEITKLRVGRENLISLPGHEPEAAGSPFEDDE